MAYPATQKQVTYHLCMECNGEFQDKSSLKGCSKCGIELCRKCRRIWEEPRDIPVGESACPFCGERVLRK